MKNCENRIDVERFVNGNVVEGELEQIAQHIVECDVCRRYADDRLAGEELPRLAAGAVTDVDLDPLISLAIKAGKGLATQREATVGKSESDTKKTLREESALPELPSRYQIIARLGKGNFGRVFLAWDCELHRKVAIKTSRLESDESINRDLLKEARLAAQIRHPNVMSVIDVGTTAGRQTFLCLEYVDGVTLDEYRQEKSLSDDEIAELVSKVASACHELHSRELIHRDIKPGNIIVTQDGEPFVTDFGLAVTEERQRLHAGEFAGTLPYMAPEQITRDTHMADGRTDIWAIGVIMYELLTNRRPFTGSEMQLRDEILHREPKPPRQLRENIPVNLERICLRCLSKPISQRFSTAKDIERELQSRPANRWKPWVLGIAAVLLVALIGGIGFGLALQLNRPTKHSLYPGVWNALPVSEATAVVAPIVPGKNRVHCNPATREISIDADDRIMMQLVEIDRKAFRFRVRLQKNSWAGDAGIFWGLKSEELEKGTLYSVNTLFVNSNRADDGLYQLEAKRYEILKTDTDPPVFANIRKPEHFARKIIDFELSDDDLVMEIEIHDARLFRVTLGEIKDANFVLEEKRQYEFPAEGGVGVFSLNGASNFLRPELFFYED